MVRPHKRGYGVDAPKYSLWGVHSVSGTWSFDLPTFAMTCDDGFSKSRRLALQ